MKTKILLGLCGLLLVSGASVAVAEEGSRKPPRGESTRPFHGVRHGARPDGHHARLRESARRLRRAREFVRSLEITDTQRAQAREAAKALEPLADDLRPRAREILERARAFRSAGDREGARSLLRDELRPPLQGAKTRALPIVEPLIDSLSPAQRAKLEQAARAHGREFDEQRAARRLARVLARPNSWSR